MVEFVTVFLIVLATYRVTCFLVEDRLIVGVRTRIQEWADRNYEEDSEYWQSRLAYLLSCMWCMSVWVSGLIVLGTMIFVSVPLPVLVWLASSGATGFLDKFGQR
jgi:hypothetical protein